MNESTKRQGELLLEWQKEVDQWICSIGQGYFHPTTNALLLVEELGELTESWERLQKQEVPSSAFADELVDLLWVTLALALSTLGRLELEESIRDSAITSPYSLYPRASQIARIIARLYGEQTAKEGDTLDLKSALELFINGLLQLAQQEKINLSEAFRENIDKKTRRDKTRHLNRHK